MKNIILYMFMLLGVVTLNASDAGLLTIPVTVPICGQEVPIKVSVDQRFVAAAASVVGQMAMDKVTEVSGVVYKPLDTAVIYGYTGSLGFVNRIVGSEYLSELQNDASGSVSNNFNRAILGARVAVTAGVCYGVYSTYKKLKQSRQKKFADKEVEVCEESFEPKTEPTTPTSS